MSKSVGNVIDPLEFSERYGSDTLRYYTMSEVGVGQDLNFSEERLILTHNDILANTYGNLVNRVVSLWIAHRDSDTSSVNILEWVGENNPLQKPYLQAVYEHDTQKMAAVIRDVLDQANNYLNVTEPWKQSGLKKEEILLETLRYVITATLMLYPFVPKATQQVRVALGIRSDITLLDGVCLELTKIQKPDILFQKIAR